jgi:hypothetical protein
MDESLGKYHEVVRSICRGLEGLDVVFSDQDGKLVPAVSRVTLEDAEIEAATEGEEGEGEGQVRMLRSVTLPTDDVSLPDFLELLPVVLEKCQIRSLKKCEPIKCLLE